MIWHLSDRCDPRAASLADRHYSRQTVGAVGFVQPGRCLVLVSSEPVRAVWVTSWPFAEYTKHQWAGSWVCSMFRNENGSEWRSSELIIDAGPCNRYHRLHGPDSWRCSEEPDQGMITFVRAPAVKSANPGYCFKKAGFSHVGYTKTDRLHALQLTPDRMPEPRQPGHKTFPHGQSSIFDLVIGKGSQ